MTKLLSIVIPISGNISNLKNLKETLRNSYKVENEAEFILLFDEKNTPQSLKNWVEISSLPLQNVKLHRQTFSSVGSARNFGLNQATSPWITFTDADDVNHVDRFVSMIRAADLEKSEIAIGDYNSVSVKSVKTIIDKSAILVPEEFEIPFGLRPGIWRCAFRFESKNELEFPNLSMAEDQIFIAKFFDVARKIHFSSQIVYDYFVGDKSSLTNRMEEIQKISYAIPISIRIANETKGPYPVLLETLAISQLLSSIKHGSIWLRISSLLKLIGFLSDGFYHRTRVRFQIVLRIAKR